MLDPSNLDLAAILDSWFNGHARPIDLSALDLAVMANQDNYV